MLQILRLFFIGVIMLFVACGSHEKSDNTKDSKPLLKVGLNAEYPPFEFKKDAKIVGFDIDLLEAISKKVGFDYTLEHMSFDGLIPALKAGKIDMIMSGMSATAERMKQVDFSIPYYEGRTLFIKQKGNETITNKDSIRGKRIGVYIGTVQEQGINKIKDEYNLNVIPSDNIFTVVMNLKQGKIDVAVADYATAQGYLNQNPDLIGFYDESDQSEGLSIAFDKHKHGELLAKINQAIKDLKASGEYDNILQKWKLK